ncbi:outer membrane protein assembly factor BamB family protein [Schlesneria paludicola]|uniref:outer membrane protein assembly factor BamB family protein n=1 Tax=Schlesneria paludicola TaxID=360056 RepID=UPI001872B1F2|nr:PQQ-binding-like beta-propeller repeat protein [Schlesneria paludicola]
MSRTQPTSIGRQQFNDICIPEREVLPLHCRIGWNKSQFEVTAATSDGVEVNGTTVVQAGLRSGDVIRIGTVDLLFDASPADAGHSKDASPPRPKKVSAKKAEPAEPNVDDMSLFDGKVMTESQAVMEAMFNDDEDEQDDVFAGDLSHASFERKKYGKVESTTGGRRPVRPGEQEVLKSPLVLGLSGGALVLLLVTGIFWFLINREQSNRLYDRALSEMNGGQYAQSISSFERFLAQYPNHGLHRHAVRGLTRAMIQKDISGAAPAWKPGLEKLNGLIKVHRNESDFSDLHSAIFQYAEQISMGAAKSAETARDPEMLVVSKEAQNLLERYADPATPPVGTVARINDQRLKADRAIEKQQAFDLAMKTVDDALAKREPMRALAEADRLVKLFPEFLQSKRVKDTQLKSLDLERSVVAVDDTERRAESSDGPAPPHEPVVGLLHLRSRTDESSQGRVVFAIAKDSCYAIDTVTGELVWRRVVGINSPFFPVLTSAAQSSVVLFDTRTQSILACELATGNLIWRQPLNSRAIGAPLQHEGQLYLALADQSLVRIDVDTGRLSATVHFSQNLASTPALSRDGEFLLVPGEKAMIYTLSLKSTSAQPTLSAIATTFTDHAAGSISAPPLSMGQLLLLCENDQVDSARLRLWDAGKPGQSLVELASTRVTGQVRDTPVLRGNQLVVPSSGEQFAAFAVSDEAGHAGISPIGQYRADQANVRERINAPLFVALGADGQFWSAGSAFRHFEIVSDSIRMDSNSTAPGIASQPLQLVGDNFFVGRKSRYSDAVTFSPVEREKLVNPWRCIVGDAPLEVGPTRDDGIAWVGESGTVYSLSKNRVMNGGVDLKAGVDLELPANITKPIRATLLDDQRLVLAAGGDTNRLFVLNNAGQISSQYPLNDMPATDPVLLDDGLVLPLSGRLALLSLTSAKKKVQEYHVPVGDGQDHKWAHLVRVDGRELIACDAVGRIIRIQLRQADVPHLAEVAKLQLEHPIDVRPIVRGESLYVADASGVCRQLNVHSFDTDGQSRLEAPVKNLWLPGDNLVVHAGDGLLHCLSEGKNLPEKWNYNLGPEQPTGPILLRDDTLWVACRSGVVLVLNSQTGEELKRIVLPQSLSLGLRQVNNTLLAIASDATIYRLE